MNLAKMKNKKGDKYFYYYDYGRGKGQRPATGKFTYVKPKDQIEKNHNKETLAILAAMKSQQTLSHQAIGTNYIPAHKFKANFLDYYQEYVSANQREGNRHLTGSLSHFKAFIKLDFKDEGRQSIAPMDITEIRCKRFRQYLLDRFNGSTPADYYTRFKWVMKAATREGYYLHNPTEEIKSKSNPASFIKDNLEVDEYLKLIKTPCLNQEVKEAFILSCYTGLRYVDVKKLTWQDIKGATMKTGMRQAKTKQPVILTLHPVAQTILERRKSRLEEVELEKRVFYLPCNDGCNKLLQQWKDAAKIEKHITWSVARLSFSILLLDEGVDDATVACLMGHTTTEQVRKNYKRHRPKNQQETIMILPMPSQVSFI